MPESIYNALFLCARNSARSIFAEALLNNLGQGRFQAFSAGSHPAGAVNPYAMELLQKNQLPIDKVRSKHSTEFTGTESPRLDFLILICDRAANECCPDLQGYAATACWNIPDPVRVVGSETNKRHAFLETMNLLQRRISFLVCLPSEKLERLRLQPSPCGIGRPA